MPVLDEALDDPSGVSDLLDLLQVETAGDDRIVGTDEAATVDALAGDDPVEGRGGHDDLAGGDGGDTLSGSRGRHDLDETGRDGIDLTALDIAFEDPVIRGVDGGEDTLIRFDGGRIRLEDVPPGERFEADFIFQGPKSSKETNRLDVARVPDRTARGGTDRPDDRAGTARGATL